jgi:orotidine-5'-phosphate decarboxylase
MKNPIIVALDVPSAEEARELVRQLAGAVDFYKVGMELYASAGMEFVRELVEEGRQVFLDMKFYDIPATVERAVRQVAGAGVRFLTVHGSGPVMRGAVAGAADSDLELLAVTVLTSFDEEDLQDLGYSCTPSELVELRVRKAREVGVHGVVCSPLEVAGVRQVAGTEAVLVTPGVRSKGADAGDQKRVATPAEAIHNGADYLVIGREITRAEDPAAAARRILADLGQGPR